MFRQRLISAFLVALGLAVICSSCSKAEPPPPKVDPAAAQAAAVEKEAQDAVMAEIEKQWQKGPDGWTTVRMLGSKSSPSLCVRQLRDIRIDEVKKLDPSDPAALPGAEWFGEVYVAQSGVREAGDNGIMLEGITGSTYERKHGVWSAWLDFKPEPVRVQKIKGKWEVNMNTWMLKGRLPTPADFAKAGVK